jgi:hypothetical protein
MVGSQGVQMDTEIGKGNVSESSGGISGGLSDGGVDGGRVGTGLGEGTG